MYGYLFHPCVYVYVCVYIHTYIYIYIYIRGGDMTSATHAGTTNNLVNVIQNGLKIIH